MGNVARSKKYPTRGVCPPLPAVRQPTLAASHSIGRPANRRLGFHALVCRRKPAWAIGTKACRGLRSGMTLPALDRDFEIHQTPQLSFPRRRESTHESRAKTRQSRNRQQPSQGNVVRPKATQGESKTSRGEGLVPRWGRGGEWQNPPCQFAVPTHNSGFSYLGVPAPAGMSDWYESMSQTPIRDDFTRLGS